MSYTRIYAPSNLRLWTCRKGVIRGPHGASALGRLWHVVLYIAATTTVQLQRIDMPRRSERLRNKSAGMVLLPLNPLLPLQQVTWPSLARQAPGKATRRVTKRGSLKSMLNMPFDILFEVSRMLTREKETRQCVLPDRFLAT